MKPPHHTYHSNLMAAILDFQVHIVMPKDKSLAPDIFEISNEHALRNSKEKNFMMQNKLYMPALGLMWLSRFPSNGIKKSLT